MACHSGVRTGSPFRRVQLVLGVFAAVACTISAESRGDASRDREDELIEDICGEYWAKTPPLPYTEAAYAFGFQDFSEFGDYAAALDPDQAVLLGCSVTVVAQALQEQGE